VPTVVAIPAIIIAIIKNITSAPSVEEPQNFRNGTPQNFWNHHRWGAMEDDARIAQHRARIDGLLAPVEGHAALP
jgi:hypothetical protein